MSTKKVKQPKDDVLVKCSECQVLYADRESTQSVHKSACGKLSSENIAHDFVRDDQVIFVRNLVKSALPADLKKFERKVGPIDT